MPTHQPTAPQGHRDVGGCCALVIHSLTSLLHKYQVSSTELLLMLGGRGLRKGRKARTDPGHSGGVIAILHHNCEHARGNGPMNVQNV
jgi:hypothetical protein